VLTPSAWSPGDRPRPPGTASLEAILARAVPADWHVAPRPGGGQVLLMTLADGGVREYAFDADGRPLHVEERRPFGRLCVVFDHDGSGRLWREVFTRYEEDEPVCIRHAEHHYDDAGQLARVEVTDALGRRVEEHAFSPAGRLREICRFDDLGRVTYREVHAYDAGGRVERVQRRRVDPAYDPHPVWDSTELRRYDPDTGRLVSCTLIERSNEAVPGEPALWRRVMEEVIDFHPERDEEPLRDETLFFDPGPDGAEIERHRILMSYGAVDGDGLPTVQVIEEDFGTGEVRERWACLV
jgi:hypothetical protein